MKLTNYALPLVALGTAALLIAPGQEAIGYSTIGGSLSASGQRDFRVFNNFSDSQANNNTTPHANLPGWDGAELAIWKGCIEWNSSSHGDGSGDPTQGNLGDGGANFDAFFAGAASGIGNSNQNIHSTISSCGGGTLAYTETPISDGWRIRYCENWTWQDGPGSVGGGIDLQGVACHEYGHALGLGHSTSGAATMFPSISGTGVSARSIATDDQNGVRAVYGTASAGKPSITGISLSGATLTITGSNFSTSGNEVWFTNANTTGTATDPRVRLQNVSSTGGGTTITVGVPGSANPGNIIVRNSGSGHSSLSNTWPFDPSGVAGQVMISSVSPSTVENLILGTAETITISGSGFTSNSTIEINGNPIAGSYTYVDGTTMTFEWEPVSTLGVQTLSVVDGANSDSTTMTVFANSSITLQVGTGDPGNLLSGSAEVAMAGPPGSFHYLLVSPENVPSVLPGKLNLGLGNVFTSIFELGLFGIGSSGVTTTTIPLTGVSTTFLFWQSLDIKLPLALNYPLQESPLQTTFVL